MAEVLKALSAALVETVAAAEAGIVRVDARRRLGASGIVWSADGVIVTGQGCDAYCETECISSGKGNFLTTYLYQHTS